MTIAERAAVVQERIAAAAARAGRRPEEVTLVAVTKTHPVATLREAIAAGLRDLGENYVQELAEKMPLVDGARWHFIGHLQRNKAKELAGRVALVHGVDSLALAEAIGKRVPPGQVQDILVQVNLAGETTKSGVSEAEVPALAAGIAALPSVRLRGLMTIPPPDEDNRARFRALAALARRLGLTELSMGMSDDFETAIEEGATLVRVGTAIFGARPKP
jgi:PLP dependent protein